MENLEEGEGERGEPRRGDATDVRVIAQAPKHGRGRRGERLYLFMNIW